MVINTYLSTIDSKKQNKQAEWKQNHRYRVHFDSCQVGGGLGVWAKKVKGLRSTNWWLQNSDGDVKYSTGNRVNNIVLAMYRIRWVLGLSGWSLNNVA